MHTAAGGRRAARHAVGASSIHLDQRWMGASDPAQLPSSATRVTGHAARRAPPHADRPLGHSGEERASNTRAAVTGWKWQGRAGRLAAWHRSTAGRASFARPRRASSARLAEALALTRASRVPSTVHDSTHARRLRVECRHAVRRAASVHPRPAMSVLPDGLPRSTPPAVSVLPDAPVPRRRDGGHSGPSHGRGVWRATLPTHHALTKARCGTVACDWSWRRGVCGDHSGLPGIGPGDA